MLISEEVKKPGKDILTANTVMGELLDQMLLVEGFYRIGPVVGILTSGAEWMVAWLPEDADVFATHESATKSPTEFNTQQAAPPATALLAPHLPNRYPYHMPWMWM